MNKIYVGNLAFSTTEEDLRDHLKEHGEIKSLKLVVDRHSGQSKGFAFVEMDNADSVIETLNGKDLGGRPLKLDMAK